MIYTSAFINLLVCLILFLYHWPQKKEIFILILAIVGANIRQYIYLLVDMPQEINIYTLLFLHADPLSYVWGPFPSKNVFYFLIIGLILDATTGVSIYSRIRICWICPATRKIHTKNLCLRDGTRPVISRCIIRT